ncbi:Short chain dehydrogenase [Lachnellula occidentalis]|uniref:Short chain dehydrogenase n=1 Tax=Lachnellula occidentalis TaxID=215460 RepID=A0A8H8UBF4_9HELO|nr:Short chain dehydrogenase [Lachnellula occidentalis]
MAILEDLRLQFEKLPYPVADCTGKTIVVVGSNTGMGKEAARHFARLNASKVIIAVRSIARGEEAKADIESTTKRTGVLEVWELDLARYASVQAFAARLATLPRVDAVVANASIAKHKFELFEGNESQITVNVISTFLLILLVLPTLRKVAATCEITPVITVVSSDIHSWTQFPEWKAPNTLGKLNDEKTSNMPDRYPVSKLLQIFASREIAAKIADEKPKVVLNIISPGLTKTSLSRDATGSTKIAMAVMKSLLGRTSEEGGRTLVHAATAGPESHGIYFTNCDLNKGPLSDFVKSAEGDKAQKKLWEEILAKLEIIQPGISSNL